MTKTQVLQVEKSGNKRNDYLICIGDGFNSMIISTVVHNIVTKELDLYDLTGALKMHH